MTVLTARVETEKSAFDRRSTRSKYSAGAALASRRLWNKFEPRFHASRAAGVGERYVILVGVGSSLGKVTTIPHPQLSSLVSKAPCAVSLTCPACLTGCFSIVKPPLFNLSHSLESSSAHPRHPCYCLRLCSRASFARPYIWVLSFPG